MKVKEFIELNHDKYCEYYIAIYIWGHHANFAPDYIGEFSRKIEYIKYWDCEIESVNQTTTRINLFLAFSEKKDTKLIKIKVNDKDRETLASMLDYAVTASEQCASEFEDLREHYLDINKNFKDLRQRIVYEELEKPKEESKSPLPNVKWSDLNKMETFLNNTICSTHAVIKEVKDEKEV